MIRSQVSIKFFLLKLDLIVESLKSKGLDALMQVITCGEQIGWREGVRKIIILITDKEPHFAYDGILGGLIMPHDSQCHLAPLPNGAYRSGLGNNFEV